MSMTAVDQIARAVLYEGYVLYPYRPSAIKNQQRWNFGVLYPPSWAAGQTGSDRSYFQMECLCECAPGASLDVSLRFLQLVARDDGGREWQEGIEQTIALTGISVAEISVQPRANPFSLPGGEESTAGVPRRKAPLDGRIELATTPVSPSAFRLTLRVMNTSSADVSHRNDALRHSLASAHAVLRLQGGRFISQLDPPEQFREASAACQNTGVWPVLVGDAAAQDTILASPIILYDYPQVAPESSGDLFDGTEIDEILTLRILTLTDQEKEEIRRSDERARQLLERLESAPQEHLLQLHGKIREVQRSGRAAFQKGDRVRLRPRKRADIFDTLLDGKIAIIEAVEQDFENNLHYAVVIEDDPGRDLGEMRQIGHRFFFSPEEVEPAEEGGFQPAQVFRPASE